MYHGILDWNDAITMTDVRVLPAGSAESGVGSSSVEKPVRFASDRLISCVVPAYNEHDNLLVLLPLLRQELRSLTDTWEVVVVDDGSLDATSDLMRAWSQQPGFRFIELTRNFGKEAALTAGLEAAEGDIVILMDADLQHSPELLASMVKRWEHGVDMVYAVRESRQDEGWRKRLGTRLFYALLHSGNRVKVPPNAGDFRLMDRDVVDALLRLPERNRFMKGLYAWVGFRTEPIAYMPQSRMSGQSSFNVRSLWRLASTGLTSFTTWPLRAVSILGFLVSMCSFIYGIMIVIEHLFHDNPVAGWPTIVTILLFFSGINLLSLGVVGEYIARIYDEVKGRPLYLVRRSSGQSLRRERPELANQERQHSDGYENTGQ